MTVEVGAEAPDFTLKDQNGQPVTLAGCLRVSVVGKPDEPDARFFGLLHLLPLAFYQAEVPIQDMNRGILVGLFQCHCVLQGNPASDGTATALFVHRINTIDYDHIFPRCEFAFLEQAFKVQLCYNARIFAVPVVPDRLDLLHSRCHDDGRCRKGVASSIRSHRDLVVPDIAFNVFDDGLGIHRDAGVL